MEINPRLTMSLLSVGSEKTPVIVIDDFMTSLESVRNQALQASYATPPRGLFYPGLTSPVDGAYGNALLRAIAPIFHREEFNVPRGLTLYPVDGIFSLITTQQEDLRTRQRLPHFDRPSENAFAVLHYLNEGEFGGTAFYRHKPSGYERVSESRVSIFEETLGNFLGENGEPEKKYFTDSSEHFELLDVVPYKQNRLVIYPSNVLHSAYIKNPSRDVNSSPVEGRLTANFFITFA
ncbi:DUF6445 family protein [Agaribacterium sp. ZY112]|uniref:DUF6445 family protein n=1 Tax=Agaribacterium sp. ZY112 TaxID=3233574 RepID=UPI00352663AE